MKKPRVVTEENKAIAKAAQSIFGCKPKVWTHADEREESFIDILSCVDRPYEFVTSYSTIGLSDYSIDLYVEGIPLRVEIVGACASEFDQFQYMVGSCGFNIINSHFKCYPGAIFKDVVKMYMPISPMKHVLFVPPFVWEKDFETLHFTKKKVAWLQAIPISEGELQYADEKGVDALESLFEDKQIDIFDLNRKSIL